MNQVFINEAFSKAISNYLSSADQPQGILYNSFLVVIIRLLINIYSELDIVNPMVVNDEELLITNLSKYGYEKENIKLFLSKIQLYYDLEKENEHKVVKFKNKYFVDIQKDLIDMFIAKNLAIKASEIEPAMVVPIAPYGIISEAQHKIGTLSISSQLQYQILEEQFINKIIDRTKTPEMEKIRIYVNKYIDKKI